MMSNLIQNRLSYLFHTIFNIFFKFEAKELKNRQYFGKHKIFIFYNSY